MFRTSVTSEDSLNAISENCGEILLKVCLLMADVTGANPG